MRDSGRQVNETVSCPTQAEPELDVVASAERVVQSSDGESNGNHQFIIAPGNTDLTNNRANSVTFSFTSAGGTF